jgi:hypothetical protein
MTFFILPSFEIKVSAMTLHLLEVNCPSLYLSYWLAVSSKKAANPKIDREQTLETVICEIGEDKTR